MLVKKGSGYRSIVTFVFTVPCLEELLRGENKLKTGLPGMRAIFCRYFLLKHCLSTKNLESTNRGSADPYIRNVDRVTASWKSARRLNRWSQSSPTEVSELDERTSERCPQRPGRCTLAKTKLSEPRLNLHSLVPRRS
jgi:hypothetical protein